MSHTMVLINWTTSDTVFVQVLRAVQEWKEKYAYLDLQVGWHDFLHNVASTVESHSVHITDEEQGSVITSPVGCAWLNIVSLVPFRVSRFAMLHDIAKVVYKKQQSRLLSEMESATSSRQITQKQVTPTPNLLAPILRMCVHCNI